MKPALRRVVVLATVLTVFGGGGWYVDSQRAKQRSTLSGFFETQPTNIASRIGGRVVSIHAKEGETATAGQALVELEANTNRVELASREATAAQIGQQLQEVKNGARSEDIRRQEQVVLEMQAALEKLKNGSRPEEIRQAQARVQQAQAVYKKVLAGARPEEIEQAQANERNAKAKLEQAQRGLTPEERAQVKARFEAAGVAERLARSDAERIEALFREGAVARRDRDHAEAELKQATERRNEAEQAWRRAELGTPQEELRQAQEGYQQAKAAMSLLLAGSRKEDITIAAADLEATRQSLQLLQRGSRAEDIKAAEARLAQANATLDALHAGSRKEQIAQWAASEQAAKAQALLSKTNLAEKVVRAPQAGVIERVFVAIGDLIAPNTPLVRLTIPEDIWIRVYIPEAKLAQVTVGGSASLRVDGIPQPLEGYVESIATRGEFTPANLQTPNERGKQVFAVRLRLRKPDPHVKAGMYATVTRIGDWDTVNSR